jgi:uncharacterized protein
VIGEVNAVLYVSTSAKDADIAVKLVDVYPDGKAYNLHDTVYRLRYREGFDKSVQAQKDQVYKIVVTGIVTGNHFGLGHRMRVEIAGSNFPNHERNLQTGGHNYDETKGVAAQIRIHHDPTYPSYLSVPLYTGLTDGQIEAANRKAAASTFGR